MSERLTTNELALRELWRVASVFLSSDLRQADPPAEMLHLLDAWGRHPQFFEYALVLLRAWVELAPDSVLAKKRLGGLLADLYMLEEGIEFESSGIPRPPLAGDAANRRMEEVRGLRLSQLMNGELERAFELERARSVDGVSVLSDELGGRSSDE